MREIQLFIKPEGETDYVKIDLFGDESISLTQTIKNANDVSKMFTDFSKSFTVPASKINNKIFKHYDKFVIDNTFDARKRVDARIEINRVVFKYGRVRLDGVDIKNNAVYAYRLTFFGNTIKLKDAIGEEKLSVLDLSRHDQVYSQSEVKAALLADPEAEDVDVIVPLITHSQRLTYGSNSGPNTGDLKPGGNNGVLWSELKYAIRIDKIVQAIATHYGFTYSADSFFNHTIENPNLPYYNLFMWLHRKKGGVLSDILQDPLLSLVSGFVQLTPANSFSYTNGTGVILTYTRDMTQFSIEIDNPSLITYDVSLRRDGEERLLRRNISDLSTTIDLLFDARDNSSYEVYAYATSTGDLTFTWTAVLEEPGYPIEVAEFAATQSIGSEPSFNISEQIPEMKVMDFLSALFKMFNLVATVDENNVVTVKTLDVYYGEGDVRDITKYVHNDSGSVDAAIPYAEISLKYSDTETILAKQFDQLKNREWGSDTYNSEDNLKEGGTFSLEVPFSHMQYERLTDLSTNNLTNVMYGYYVDDNQDAYLGAPLVFYPILNPLGSYPISYVTTTDANGDFTATETISTSIIIPSNSVYVSEYVDTDNIHFFPEASEYYPNFAPYKTLFYNYHWNYIASLFNFRKRMTKIRATLPVNFLINYSLADTILYKGLSYRINSINTNLNSGDSSLELLNVVNVARPIYPGPTSTTSTTTSTTSTTSTTTTTTTSTTSTTTSTTSTTTTTTTQAPALIELYARNLFGTESVTIYYTVNGGSQQTAFSGPLNTNCSLVVGNLGPFSDGDVITLYTDKPQLSAVAGIGSCPPFVGEDTSFITQVSTGTNTVYLTINTGTDLNSCYEWDVECDNVSGCLIEYTDCFNVFQQTNLAYLEGISICALPTPTGGIVNLFGECTPITTTTTTTTIAPAADLQIYAKALVSSFAGITYSVNEGPIEEFFSGNLSDSCGFVGGIFNLDPGDSVTLYQDNNNFIEGAVGAGNCPATVGSLTSYTIVVQVGQNDVSLTLNTGAITTTTSTTTTTTTAAVTCFEYEILNQGSSSATFSYEDCSTGSTLYITVDAGLDGFVCARENTIQYFSGDTNYSIFNVAPC